MKIKGIIALLLATMSYGTWGIFSRLIGSEFGAFSQNWVRSLLIVILLSIFFFFRKEFWKNIEKKDIKWLLSWTFSGAWVMVLLFVAFNNLPLATVYFLFYSTMIVGGYVAGKILYKEKLTTIKIVSVLLAVAGLIMIYSVGFPPNKLIYIFISLLSGLLIGLWNSLSKKVSNKYSNLQLTCIYALVTFILSIIGALVFKESVPIFRFNYEWFEMFGFALTSIASTVFLVYGFKYLEASTGSIIMPMEVVFASIFGFLFFNETLTLTALIGGLLIASAAILPNIQLFFKKKVDFLR